MMTEKLYATLQPYQRQFIELAMRRQVLQFGQFTLKSGRSSPYFFNMGLFNTGEDLTLVGQYYASALLHANTPFDLLFGLAYKGIPLVVSTAMALSQQHHTNIPYCFNRKECKDHGEGGILIGSKLQGRIVLIDDVISAGTAIRKAMPLITANGAKLVCILIAFDRQERGIHAQSTLQELEQQYCCRVIPIISLTHLLTYLSAHPTLHHTLSCIYHYQQQYGAVKLDPLQAAE